MKQMSNFGGVVTFDIKAGKWAAFETLNRLKLIDISNNLGDAKSMVTHPATTTHMRIGAEERAKLGIGDGTVRISVGLEDAEDIIGDLVQALAARRRPGHVAGRELWRANADLAERILAHPFVQGLGDGSLPVAASSATWRRTPISSTPSRAPTPSAWRTARRATTSFGFSELIAGVLDELKLHKSYAERWQVALAGVTPLAGDHRPMSISCSRPRGRGDSARPSPAMTPCMRLYAFLGQSLARGRWRRSTPIG